MTDTPRRRVSDKVSGSPTFIGAASEFVGELRCQGDVIVGGSFKGEGTVDGSFTLSEGGVWDGQLRAGNAVVAGEVFGELIVTEKLEIRKSARIRGSVSARSIAIAKGAVIEGEVSVTSGAPIVNFEEKRQE